MKFEHLKRKNYFLNLMKIKKQKLKLGLVSFEIQPIFFNGIKIYEFMEMRYSRQDTTKDDESKITTRLEKLKWKWTLSHIISLFIVLFFIWNYLYLNIYLYYFNLILPTQSLFFIDSLPNNLLLDLIFKNNFNIFTKLDLLNKINTEIVSFLIQLMNL